MKFEFLPPRRLGKCCDRRLSRAPSGYTNNATILFGNYYDPDDGAGAFAFYPGSTAASSAAGDVWLDTDSINTGSLPVRGFSYFAIMHDLGHALGLSHPGIGLPGVPFP